MLLSLKVAWLEKFPSITAHRLDIRPFHFKGTFDKAPPFCFNPVDSAFAWNIILISQVWARL
jgi:hypothetical protein